MSKPIYNRSANAVLLNDKNIFKIKNENFKTENNNITNQEKRIITYDINSHRSCSPQFENVDLYECIFGSYHRRNINYNIVENLNRNDNINRVSKMEMEKDDYSTVCDLKKQIIELSKKLTASEKDRAELNKKFNESNDEKERIYKRLEVITSSHESRITEMHCVIAELNKKLRSKQNITILEETEAEGSELSFQEASEHNSGTSISQPCTDCGIESKDIKLERQTDPAATYANNIKIEELQEEIFRLKAQIAYLESRIANKSDISQESILNEHERRNNSPQLDEKYKIYTDLDEESRDDFSDCYGKETENNYKYMTKPAESIGFRCRVEDAEHKVTGQTSKVSLINPDVPVAKMAERVKLRKTVEDKRITGSDLLSNKINSTKIAEHLVAGIIKSENNALDETGPLNFLSEIERLERRIEYLKTKNKILSLTLNECKQHCERLYLLCGKYESNAIALQSALNFSDRAIEAYDVMLALLESKLVILKEDSYSAHESRRNVEAVARHLLDRLESQKNINENSVGPWQNAVSINNAQIAPWTQQEDDRLRNHVSKLKGRRSAVQNTVVIFESPFYSEYKDNEPINKRNARSENSSQDLEMAVLMQELITLRNDVTELRRKCFEAEKERNLANEKINIREEIISQLKISKADIESQISGKELLSYADPDHALGIERQLIEALARESQLKSRIHTIIDKASTSKVFLETQPQVQNNLVDLEKENINLKQSLEECKRKYILRIKQLEQKLVEMSSQIKKSLPQESVPETTL